MARRDLPTGRESESSSEAGQEGLSIDEDDLLRGEGRLKLEGTRGFG